MFTTQTLSILALLITVVRGHSYVVEAREVVHGTFVGRPGYPRGYGTLICSFVDLKLTVEVDPSVTTFDVQMTHLLPYSPRTSLTDADLVCKATQVFGNQSEAFPSLRIHAGDFVALRYRENGHITKPEPEKLTFGSVSVYGTTNAREDDKLTSIHHIWNANNTGGDLRGRLLQRQSFDDGSCYESNESSLSAVRSIKGQPPHDNIDGSSLACKVVVKIPYDVPKGTAYTLYWVWDWPSVSGHVAIGTIKEELYTTCVDIYVE